jgi:hypothetical protein
MQSVRVALDSESFLKMDVTAEGLVFATIANTRNQGIMLTKPALLRLFSQTGLIAEACEIGATMQAKAQPRASLGSQQHPVDLTASDSDDDDDDKENVHPGLPGIQKLRMRLLFSDSSDTTPDSPDQSQNDQEISSVDSASASQMQDEDKEMSTIGSASEMECTGDGVEGDMDYGTDDDEVFL